PSHAADDDVARRTVDGRPRKLDWSILMGHAQAGDKRAYRRLLEDIAPYVRALAAKHHRDPRDIEDSVQDILLTVHAIRQTYDPTRPFGPWLVAIAPRRIADRLRRRARSVARETPLIDEGETIAAPAANYQEPISDAGVLREAIARLPQGQRN